MPKLEISATFKLAASHFLPNYRGECEKMHGHNYKIIVTIEGEIKEDGMVMDFKELKKIVKTHAIDKLDHTHLNDTLENPSAENIAVWIWEKLKPELPGLKNVKIFETDDYYCSYNGN